MEHYFHPAAFAIAVFAAKPARRIRTAIRGVPASQNHATTAKTPYAIMAGMNFRFTLASPNRNVIRKGKPQYHALSLEFDG
jgi:hypothetical protein